MTYLELCQQLRGDCGIQGDGPSSVLNQSGMSAKLVRWVREANNEIQSMPFEWKFLRSTVSLPVTMGASDYPLGAGPWSRPDIRFFEPAHAILLRVDDTYLRVRPVPFDWFQTRYPVIDTTPATPMFLTVTPDNIVRFNSRPDADYTLQATVKVAPQQLAADADVPLIPAEFQSAIVQKAKMKYATHDDAASVFQAANSAYKEALRSLVSSQVPVVVHRALSTVR